MSKCSECGAELTEGVKFCSECGTKVPVQNKCPSCGAICVPGAKFCGECGHKLSAAPTTTPEKKNEEAPEVSPKMAIEDLLGDETEVEACAEEEEKEGASGERESGETESTGSCGIDWEGKAKIEEIQMALDDDQVRAINVDLESLQASAADGRVLLFGEDGFEEKFKAFKSVYEDRVGICCDEFPLFQESCLIGLVDNSAAGTGKRGTLFTRLGMIVIDGDFPAAVEGDEPLSGIVPWKLFYIFSEPAEEFYRLMKPVTASKSDKVDDEIRGDLEADIAKPNGRNNLLFRYSNVGVGKEEVAEFMEGLKSSLSDCGDVAFEEDD